MSNFIFIFYARLVLKSKNPIKLAIINLPAGKNYNSSETIRFHLTLSLLH